MNKTLTILVCIMVAGVVVGASLPIFDSLTASSESVHNEGAGWVRFALDRNADTTYSLSYTEDGNGFYIDNGTDRQTYDDSSTSNFETILYADSNLSVWYDDAIRILGTNEGNPVYLEGSSALTIVRDAEGVTVTPDGSDPVSFGVPTWSYIPVSTGNYGFFLAADFDSELGNGVKNYPSDMPLAVVGGGFAGVYAYNDIYRYNGLGLNMHPVYDEEGLFYGAYWDKTAPVEPESLNPDVLDPAVVDLTPIDIDLDPITLDPGAQLMSVPTPSYTDGEWGYEYNGDGATIVSYSGAGGNIVMPDTVGGRTVLAVGKGGSAETVINNSSISANSTLTLPSTITRVNESAFAGCDKLTGPLVIPDSVTYIGDSTFNYTKFTSLTLPNGLTHIGKYAFENNPYLTGELILPDSVTTIDQSAFNNTKISGVLKLPSNLTTLNLSAFNGCTNLTGVIIPPTITELKGSVFQGCGFTSFDIPPTLTKIGNYSVSGTKISTLIIPNTVTSIGMYAFYNTPTLTSLIVLSDATPQTSAFGSTSNLKEVLNLGNATYTTTSYGLNADEVSDSIGECFGFVSVVDVSGSGGGPTQTLIAMLPLIMVLGLVLMAVGIFVWNRM